MAIVQLGFGSAVLVAAGYLVVNFIEGNVIEPRLMGRKLGLSTLVVFLSLIFWGGLLGLVGAILSIPLTMTLKFAFESSESTKWIAVLLGSEKFDEPIRFYSKKEKTMMNTPQIENDKFDWRKISPRKFVKAISIIVGIIFLVSVLILVLFPDPFINTITKK